MHQKTGKKNKCNFYNNICIPQFFIHIITRYKFPYFFIKKYLKYIHRQLTCLFVLLLTHENY